MKICLDGIGITHLHGTKLYTYTYELYNHLFKMYSQPKYHVIWHDKNLPHKWKKNKKIKFQNLYINRIEDDYSFLEEYLNQNNIKLYHSLHNGFSIPNKKVCPYITTIYDLSILYKDDNLNKKYEKKFYRKLPKAIGKSDYIIVLSDLLKTQLVEKYPKVEKKIIRIYPGIGEAFYRFKDQTKPCEKKYLLYIGGLYQRKNIERIMDICKLIFLEDPQMKLLIVGKTSGQREQDYKKIKYYAHQLNIQDNVKFTGEVPYSKMSEIYRRALFLFNFSEYEGFSFSTLESAASGVPIICLKTPLMEELLEDAAVYVKGDPYEIKNIIWNIKENQRLYEDISKKEIRISKKYSWEKSIRQLVKIYEKVMYS